VLRPPRDDRGGLVGAETRQRRELGVSDREGADVGKLNSWGVTIQPA